MEILRYQLSAATVSFWVVQLCSQICIQTLSKVFLNRGFISILGRRMLPCMGLPSCIRTLPAPDVSSTPSHTDINNKNGHMYFWMPGFGLGVGGCAWIVNVCLSCPLGELSPTPNYRSIPFYLMQYVSQEKSWYVKHCSSYYISNMWHPRDV